MIETWERLIKTAKLLSEVQPAEEARLTEEIDNLERAHGDYLPVNMRWMLQKEQRMVEWWQKIRKVELHQPVFDMFKARPGWKNNLRKMFKRGNGKVSFYDFFTFIQNMSKIDVKLGTLDL